MTDRINTNQPVIDAKTGAPLCFIGESNGNLYFHRPNDGDKTIRTTLYGYAKGERVVENDLPETSEVFTIYPNGNVYNKCCPVETSSYGVDNLIQVRVTRRGGKIIRKEFC